jgi:hypothetical protein
MYVASVSYWIRSKKVYHIGVAKVDRDVAHVAMATRIFQVHVPNISSVADICCKYFHLDFVKVDLDVAYTCMLQALFSSVSRRFIWMLYMFAMFFKCF